MGSLILGRSGNSSAGRTLAPLLVLVFFSLLIATPPEAFSKPKKPKLTVAYGVTGQTVKVAGSVRQPGLRKRSKAANLAVLEQRVKPQGKKARWVRRAKAKVARKPGKSNRFRLQWKAPATTVKVELRTRVLNGKRQVAKGKARAFAFSGGRVQAPKVVALTPGTVTAAPSPDQPGRLVLNSGRKLKPGEVIATGVGPATPNGFLGKVVSSRIANGTTIVQTQPVSLMEAVPNASFDVSGDDLQPTEDMNPQELRFARAITGGKAIKPTDLNPLIRPAASGGGINTGKKSNACGPSDGFKAESNLRGTLGTRFAMSWNNRLGAPVSVKSARAEATFGLSQEFKLASAVGVKCSKTVSLLPKKIQFAPIAFVVGPVPVVLIPEADISLKISGEIAVKASVSVKSQLSLRAGLKYENGRTTPISSMTKSSTSDASVTKSAEASATVGPKIGMKLYGVVGPAISLRAGAKVSAEQGRTPWLKVDGLIESSALIEFTVWKIRFSVGVDGPPVSWSILRIDKEGDNPTDPTDPIDPDDPWNPVDPGTGDQLIAKSISAGWLHSCGVRASGQVVCWGWNGQFDGSNIDDSTPAAVQGLSDAKSVSAGTFHSCAVRVSGQVVCWGSNGRGELGDGSTTDSWTPVAVQGLSDAKSVSVGEFHSCALRVSGQVVCWGSNGRGELGDGSTTDSWTPVAAQGLDEVKSLSVGIIHSCAVRVSGQAVCWGSNGHGELGDGGTTDSWTPVAVQGLGDARAVSADARFGSAFTAGVHAGHSCAVRVSGQVVCWGYNGAGQLGDGSDIDRLTPAAVQGLSDAKSVSAGTFHSCAVRVSGQAACWGNNEHGELGDGSTTYRVSPVAIQDLGEAQSISAGGRHSCAIRSSGQVTCWGGNGYGQLGDGSFTDSLTPVPVLRGN